MFIIGIYGGFLLALLLFFLFTGKYKRKQIQQLPAKEHPLRFLYGTSFFLIDKFPALPFGAVRASRNKLKNNLEAIHVGKDVTQMEYLFRSQRIATTLFVFFICVFLGFCYCISIVNGKKELVSLPKTDSEESYSLEVVLDEEDTRVIDVTVEAEEFPFQDAIDLFESCREGITKAVLGDNADFMELRYPLHFITSYGDDGLTIFWESEDESIIDSEGNILYENIGPYGAYDNLRATLTLGDYSASLIIPVFVVP